MRRAGTLAAIGAAAFLLALPAAAAAGVTCTYDEDVGHLDVRVRGESSMGGDASVGHIVRDGPLIRVIRQNEANGARKRIGCGGLVRFRSTSSVSVTMRNASLGLSLHRGALPRTSVQSRTLFNVVFVGATDRSDRIDFRYSSETSGVDVNRNAGGTSDLALSARGQPLFFLQANGRGDSDVIRARGPRPSARAPIGFVGTGGAGNDVLSTGRGVALLAGGGGDDSLFGGPDADVLVGGGGRNRLIGRGGEDRIDTGDGRGLVRAGDGDDFVDAEEGFGRPGPDRIDCGSGRDRVDVDEGDQVRGCERGGPT